MKNACPSGLFIETHKPFVVGQSIELRIPDPKTRKLKLLIGVIVRSGPDGIGIRVKNICAAAGD